ncbi:MAG TPA: hypothetical protein VKQ06_13275 [Gammaproteobacteria bacterium]|nr:hypothetical protein [Gammaproteobacteria bacterium]
MKLIRKFLAIAAMTAAWSVDAQEIQTLKVAPMALTDNSQIRAQFEDGLAALASDNDYDVVPSHLIAPDVADVDNRRFLRQLADNDVGVVLMMRPAAVGTESSLTALRNAIEPEIYSSMRRFAREVSPSGGNDVFAVIHLGIYLLENNRPELLSAGAVWLDEAADSQDESIRLLQDLVLANANAVRGPIRDHIGLPPLGR